MFVNSLVREKTLMQLKPKKPQLEPHLLRFKLESLPHAIVSLIRKLAGNSRVQEINLKHVHSTLQFFFLKLSTLDSFVVELALLCHNKCSS